MATNIAFSDSGCEEMTNRWNYRISKISIYSKSCLFVNDIKKCLKKKINFSFIKNMLIFIFEKNYFYKIKVYK